MTTESLKWFKSSYSENGGQCIEVRGDLAVTHAVVPIRDSKDPDGHVLTIPSGSFADFISGVKAGAFSA
ncbi:DUF397 domain-containing protein [Streptomyces sp. MST-110588]|uniref:DUF397 domain-containing protein n=1 Tax=Streptomyces sp. MST-110588 TaxID=2833628 RepID=UPI001F5DFC32|nr:DUF397 domain-containing protein [Streptomyces sp. MST-110588]UNO39292.1 DUF397 domain-containing protein [Streptomyces sp. MST-110588]